MATPSKKGKVGDGRMETDANRNYIMDPAEFDSASGMEYGGQADILVLNVGEAAGPLIYQGVQPMILSGKTINVHLAADTVVGEQHRLPIQASFLRSIDQARLSPGDEFAVRRHEDVVKKEGVGKGTPMAIFSVKVLRRVTAVTAPAN